MLRYFKFRQQLFDPQPAKDVYIKRGKGKGWPEECPPIRAANGFGFDILANFKRPWRAITALIETDWYPASYPWHCVIELDRDEKRIKIRKGDVLCRLMPVRRDTYFASQMSPGEFDTFFERGQQWLAIHGK